MQRMQCSAKTSHKLEWHLDVMVSLSHITTHKYLITTQSQLAGSTSHTLHMITNIYIPAIEKNYSRLMMPLALSRGNLLRPRSEPSTVLGLGL